MGLRIGSNESELVKLPRLDVEKCLVFGGGADIGDDFWLTLDLRTDMNDPRVVGNHYHRKSCEWFEVTETFTRFCEILDIKLGDTENAE